MKSILFITLLFTAAIAPAQKKFSINIGVGMGGLLGETSNLPGCSSPKGSPYIAGFISGYYKVTENFSSGVQLLASGELVPTDKCTQYIPSTNTIIISGNKLPASSILLRNKYKFFSDKKLTPYIDLGLGITTFTYRSITADVRKVKKTSFAVSPELGFEVLRLSFACQAIIWGKTPVFEGYDSFSNMNKSLRATKSMQLYFSVVYRVFQF
jgi:hypothetical protein